MNRIHNQAVCKSAQVKLPTNLACVIDRFTVAIIVDLAVLKPSESLMEAVVLEAINDSVFCEEGELILIADAILDAHKEITMSYP